MMPTLKLMDIAKKWRDALKNSAEIEAFCLDKYSKNVSIFLGINHKKPPTKDDCPIIVIRPGTKVEGLNEAEFKYVISIGWAIKNENETVVDNAREIEGLAECDDLGQLILEATSEANPSYPVSSVEYELEAVDFFPQIVGEMVIELSITPAIGGNLVY